MYPLSSTRSSLRHLIICLCVLLSTSVAHAHGGNPLSQDVHTFPDGSWVLMTNFGVMTSAQPEHYVCEEIFLGGMNYQVLPFDLQTWLTISADQVARTTDGGCTFEHVAEREIAPAAVAIDQDRDLAAWLTSGPDGQSMLTWSLDRGETLQERDLSELGLIQWTGLRIDQDGAFIMSGYSEKEGERGQARMITIDVANPTQIQEYQGWEEIRYPYLFDARAGRIAGIANVNGGLALIWDEPERLIETSKPLATWPVSMRMSEDGSMLAVAGATFDGKGQLYERDAITGELLREPIFPDTPNACIAWTGPQEVAFCSRSSAQDFALARGTLDGEMAMETLVDLQQLQGPREGCAAESALQTTCSLVWPELARALRIDIPGQPGLDMGAPEPDQGMLDEQDMPADMTTDAPADMPVDMSSEEMGSNIPDMQSSPMNDDKTCSHIALSQKNDNAPIHLILFGFMLGLMRIRHAKKR